MVSNGLSQQKLLEKNILCSGNKPINNFRSKLKNPYEKVSTDNGMSEWDQNSFNKENLKYQVNNI